MQVTFRGVRGSAPWAVRDAMRTGCNTACVELRDARTGARLVLDAGTGVLGVRLDGTPGEIPVLLSHYHWDHVQGLPFFAALHEPGWTPRIVAPKLRTHDPRWLQRLFGPPFFPIPPDRLASPPAIATIRQGANRAGGFDVTAVTLHHPGDSFAYRITGVRSHLVYATDHEIGNPTCDAALADLARDAGALVLDAHFTPEEIDRYRGWGHSDWRACAELARRCRVGTLYLFHHMPGRTDDELLAIRAKAREIFPRTEIAAEGDTFEV